MGKWKGQEAVLSNYFIDTGVLVFSVRDIITAPKPRLLIPPAFQ